MASDAGIRKFVWDTSALINIKEADENGYSPACSLYKDFNDGWIQGPYLNIFPAVAIFEIWASVSRKHREGKKMLREFYIRNENSIIYEINDDLVRKCADIVTMDGFENLRGADLIFACIAYIEKAYLVTLDNHFKCIGKYVEVIDLNESRTAPVYRDLFE